MSGEWEVRTLSDVLTLQRGFDLPEASRLHGSVPIVASTGIVGGHELSKVSGPGVVIGRSGSIGGGQYIVKDFWPLNTTLYVKDFKGNDVRFCYYALRSIDFQQFNVGSGVPTLNRNHIASLSIAIPPLPEQRRIAKILGDLDDKIELNRKMNETLEEMARALFKSWFVDFDPVRAKMEGRQPTGMDAATAALFPDRLVGSELGLIPEGWEVKALGEIADFDKGLSYKGDSLAEEGGMPMVNLGCFTGRGLFSAERIKRYTGEYRERHLVNAGDLVLANTDMTQNRVIIGSPALVPEINGEKTFLFTHHVFAVRFNPDYEIWRRYIFFTLLKPDFREIAEGFSTGTTVLALPRDGVTGYLICLPPLSLIRAFERLVGPMLAAFDKHHHQSRTLSTLRDTLLPKLVSGEVRVGSHVSIL